MLFVAKFTFSSFLILKQRLVKLSKVCLRYIVN